ncbi:hypothetical protein E2C01_095379 [Portunus trituberculatus]|uniref:Uncharacterized protein n=1 Tax=Portunus trituberculatus TaxID=210409 RepID=A0A5B7JV38_PORTR|nr:hypothetical protein [Portunus trituberculatus]
MFCQWFSHYVGVTFCCRNSKEACGGQGRGRALMGRIRQTSYRVKPRVQLLRHSGLKSEQFTLGSVLASHLAATHTTRALSSLSSKPRSPSLWNVVRHRPPLD